MDREAWRAVVHGVAKNTTEQVTWTELILKILSHYFFFEHSTFSSTRMVICALWIKNVTCHISKQRCCSHQPGQARPLYHSKPQGNSGQKHNSAQWIIRHYSHSLNGATWGDSGWENRISQSISRVWLFATPWIAARQASLSITNSRSSLILAPNNGESNGTPLQSSCLENPMDRGAW